MSIVVITPPASSLVKLEDAKAFLRVEGGESDALIKTMIDSATGLISGPFGWLGRSLVTQTLEFSRDSFWHESDCDRDGIVLPNGPVQSVTTVTYTDSAGDDQVIDPTLYRLSGDSLASAYGKSWPSVRCQPGAVRVRYIAGFGDAADVPSPIKSAALLLIGHLFKNREAVTDVQPYEMPLAFQSLLTPYRVVFV